MGIVLYKSLRFPNLFFWHILNSNGTETVDFMFYLINIINFFQIYAYSKLDGSNTFETSCATEDWESCDIIMTGCEKGILERLGRSQANLWNMWLYKGYYNRVSGRCGIRTHILYSSGSTDTSVKQKKAGKCRNTNSASISFLKCKKHPSEGYFYLPFQCKGNWTSRHINIFQGLIPRTLNTNK